MALLAWPPYGLRWLVWLLGRVRRRWARVSGWVWFLIESPPPQLPPPPGPFWQRFLGQRPVSLLELERQLRLVAGDERVRGVVLHVRPISLSDAQAQALAALIAEVRAAGKRVVCWATHYSASTYLIAAGADEVLLAPGGEVGALGSSRTYMYLKDALDRVGVQANLIQITPYKTAGDVLTKSEMTRQSREMAGWLADSAFSELLDQLARGRGLDLAGARALVDRSPFTDEQAIEAHAVDKLLSEEELTGHLGGPLEPYGAVRRRLRRPPPPQPGRHVAIMRIEGVIVDGRSRRAPVRPLLPVPLLFENQAGDLSLVHEARRLARNRRVAAVVLWIDSGGGSATASFAIASALRELASAKPLLAVMGTVAASGGYEVAAPARRIYAQPGTITGSIGVLGGKVVIGGLLERLAVHHTTISRGERASLQSSLQPFSRTERQWLRSSIERSYRHFLSEVATARNRTVEQIEPVAGGRVWTGRQALGHHLVDELAGFSAAAAEARRLGGLRPDAPLKEERLRAGEAPAATPTAALEHALELGSCLERSTAWLLWPWISR